MAKDFGTHWIHTDGFNAQSPKTIKIIQVHLFSHSIFGFLALIVSKISVSLNRKFYFLNNLTQSKATKAKIKSIGIAGTNGPELKLRCRFALVERLSVWWLPTWWQVWCRIVIPLSTRLVKSRQRNCDCAGSVRGSPGPNTMAVSSHHPNTNFAKCGPLDGITFRCLSIILVCARMSSHNMVSTIW